MRSALSAVLFMGPSQAKVIAWHVDDHKGWMALKIELEHPNPLNIVGSKNVTKPYGLFCFELCACLRPVSSDMESWQLHHNQFMLWKRYEKVCCDLAIRVNIIEPL